MIHLKKRIISSAATVAALGGLGIAAAAPAQAATSSVWDAVAQCESSGDWSINTGNGFYGGLQFSASTWSEFGGTQYASGADLATKDQQIAIAQKMLAVQGPNAWPVCSKVAGLTSSNGGASSSSTATSVSSSSSSSATTSGSSASTSGSSTSGASTSESSSSGSSTSGSTSGSSTAGSSSTTTKPTATKAKKVKKAKATHAAKAKAYAAKSQRNAAHNR